MKKEPIKKERLQKLISQSGFASRLKAEEFIKKGLVKVNGKVAILGQKASFSDQITIEGKPIIDAQEKVYYLMNKPQGTICSRKDEKNRPLVFDLINDKRFLYTVGRLDYNTKGTLIITNDGELTNALTHPSNEIKRIYRARLSAPLTSDELSFLNSNNVFIDEKISKQKVEKVDTRSYLVYLKEGRNHHVKKLFKLVNKLVVNLTRIEFGGITHIGLASGQYRKLSVKEVKHLKQIANIKEKIK